MRVFALSDPHLAFATPGKEMDTFGPQWVDHPARMAAAWDELVAPGDLVLVPGDISWARKLDGARPDLEWLAARPGTKVLCKGNHEYWWASKGKVRKALPEGMHALDADAVRIGPVVIGATRLWDVPGVSYHDWIDWQGEPISEELSEADEAASLKIYRRELGRLDRALEAMRALEGGSAPGGDGGPARRRIVMLHYPPVAPGLAPNEVTERLERAGVDDVVFGHLHALDEARKHEIGGEARGVRYWLASCDFIGFRPIELVAGPVVDGGRGLPL